MKKIMALLLAALLLLPAVALADEAALTVQGTATVTLKPDMARVSVGVESNAGTVEEAVRINAETLASVVTALESAGIAAGDLSTENYYVGMRYDYSSFGEPEVQGYNVSNTLNVIVRDTEKLGAVIDAAAAAGANQIYGVTFLSTMEKDAHDEALALAVQEGLRKASLLAMAAGKQLGQLESMEENGGYSYGVNKDYDTVSMAAGTSIIAEELSVTAAVTMTFEIR